MANDVNRQAQQRTGSSPSEPDDLIEARLRLAVRAFQTGKYPSMEAAAMAYSAPYQRCLGHHSRGQDGGDETELSTEASDEDTDPSSDRRASGGTCLHSASIDSANLFGLEDIMARGKECGSSGQAGPPGDFSYLLRYLDKQLVRQQAIILADTASLKQSITGEKLELMDVIGDMIAKAFALYSAELSCLQDQHLAFKNLMRDEFTKLHEDNKVLRRDIRTLRHTLSSCLSSQSSHAFPQFQKLPIELRCMVWEWATPGKILEIQELACEVDEDGDFSIPEFRFVGNRSPPATAQVCRESRAVACRLGKLLSLQNPRYPHVEYSQLPLKNTWYKRQWAWLGHTDTLYLSSVCGRLHREHADLVGNARHFIVKREHCGAFLGEIHPHLQSLDVVFGCFEWPTGKDAETETRLWGDGQYHLPIEMVEGDAAEAKRIHDELQTRLGPHPNREARDLLTKLFTVSVDYGIFSIPSEALRFKKFPQTSAAEWIDNPHALEEGMPDPVDEYLEELEEKSMIRRIWMLSRIAEDENASQGLC
jgi:hypothetical protein